MIVEMLISIQLFNSNDLLKSHIYSHFFSYECQYFHSYWSANKFEFELRFQVFNIPSQGLGKSASTIHYNRTDPKHQEHLEENKDGGKKKIQERMKR